MKKIDLHIHTVPTRSDAFFTFSMEAFKRYVVEAQLDAVAVTNHDIFRLEQFREIEASLPVVVFPGIEINVDKGHLLVFADPADVEDFAAKAAVVETKITKIGDQLSVKELIEIFGDLNRYLLIPHYEKHPSLSTQALDELTPYLCAGEVDSAKKFVRSVNDPTKLAPVLFSDSRMRVGMESLPTRHTFVDCGTVTISALKICLKDKNKVKLSARDGNSLWQALESGQQLSTGLNVLVGARSTGKTYTLDELSKTNENVKYIKQFQLVQQDEADYDRQFKGNVERSRSTFADQYLLGLKRTLDEVMRIDSIGNTREVESYVQSLLKSAEEIDRSDSFSNAALFAEVDFPVGNITTLEALIRSVQQIIENIEYRSIIERHLQIVVLNKLFIELVETLWKISLEIEKRKFVNDLVKEVKKILKFHTSATQVEDVDLYQISMDTRRVARFQEMVSILKQQKTVYEENIRGFRIQAKRKSFSGAMEVKNVSGVKTSFVETFKKYGDAYAYLRDLLNNESLTRSELYKLFVKIDYRILNRDGFEVSGGERSEFRLLQEIEDARNYDLLLIDEPESSFDNVFLKTDVNDHLRRIAQEMPVVVVTHNSTVGASVGANYILFTAKEHENDEVIYRIYSGYPTDRELTSVDKKSMSSHPVLMDSLEAGSEAYEGRRTVYEAIKN